MKLAFSSNAYLRYSIEETIGRVASLGYRGIELLADVPHAWPAGLLEEQKQTIRDALAKHKLTISNINAFMMNAIADPRQPYWHPSWIEPDPHYRAIRREPGRVERRERECRRRQAQCARAGFAVDVGRLLGNSSLGLEGRGIGSRREYQLADIVSAS